MQAEDDWQRVTTGANKGGHRDAQNRTISPKRDVLSRLEPRRRKNAAVLKEADFDLIRVSLAIIALGPKRMDVVTVHQRQAAEGLSGVGGGCGRRGAYFPLAARPAIRRLARR